MISSRPIFHYREYRGRGKMLTVTDLLTIVNKPNQSNVSLQTIQIFYEEHLCNRLFVFQTDSKDHPTIKIRFEEDNLCHLLGFQYILRPLKDGTKYTGQPGYNLIKDGTVTFEYIKSTNNKRFKGQQDRMLYFPFVYQIVSNPTAITFNKPEIQLDVEIIFYNQVHNVYLHLGLGKQVDTDYYYPKSFFPRKKDDYISNQTLVNMISKQVILDNKK